MASQNPKTPSSKQIQIDAKQEEVLLVLVLVMHTLDREYWLVTSTIWPKKTIKAFLALLLLITRHKYLELLRGILTSGVDLQYLFEVCSSKLCKLLVAFET